jgi:hypothetical protein
MTTAATKSRNAVGRGFMTIGQAFLAGVARLDRSLSPAITFNKLRNHKFVLSDTVYIFNIFLTAYWFTIMASPHSPSN